MLVTQTLNDRCFSLVSWCLGGQVVLYTLHFILIYNKCQICLIEKEQNVNFTFLIYLDTIKRENRNLSDTSEDSNTIKRFPSKILDHKISKKEKFRAPIPVEKSDVYKCKKYTQNGSIYFSMTDLLFFLKNTFKIDCDNFILKDEQKQEFKVKMNSFMTDYTIIHSRYDQTMILIDHQNVELFFDLISKFVNKKLDELMNKFLIFSKNLKSEEVKENIEYIKPIAFVCENPIRAEEAYKKKVGHYVKYKTIPKWHHYAWDMIK